MRFFPKVLGFLGFLGVFGGGWGGVLPVIKLSLIHSIAPSGYFMYFVTSCAMQLTLELTVGQGPRIAAILRDFGPKNGSKTGQIGCPKGGVGPSFFILQGDEEEK